LKISTVGGAKVKAEVGASHPMTMAHHPTFGNLVSGGKH